MRTTHLPGYAIALFLLVSIVGVRAAAQEKSLVVPVYNSKELTAALPTLSDFVGYEQPIVGSMKGITDDEPMQAFASFVAFRKSDRTSFDIGVAVWKDAKTALEGVFALVPLSGARPPEGTVSGRRIGQKAWSFPEGHLLYVVDGRASIAIRRNPRIYVDNAGRPYRVPVTRADILLAEDKVIQTLHRLRAMGVTSEAADGAPQWAKKQVAERLTKIRAEEAEKGTATGTATTPSP